jgi:hypothetical protein
MRTILILLLVGSLLWLVLHGFRSVHAGATPTAEAGTFLMPAEANPSTPSSEPAGSAAALPKPQPAAGATGSPQAPREKPPAPPTPAPAAAPAPARPATTSVPRPVQTPSTGAADEVAMASVLFHHPQELAAYVEGPGKSVPAGRRDLALALQRLVLGATDEARRLAEGLDGRDGVLVSEVAYLKQALSSGSAAVPASSGASSPLLRAASLAAIAREAHTAAAAGKNREAALAFGELLQGEISAPWKAERDSLVAWSDALARAESGYRWNPEGGWSSIEVKVEAGDSLISVRKKALKDHSELLICTGQIARANGLRNETIHPGQVLKIPLSRANVLVDLDAHWALYRLGPEVVAAWEIGTGKPGSETPTGEFVAGEKTKDPPWFRPGHAPVPFGDPENPLGTRWIAWQKADGTNTSLGFHGTKDPSSIGEDQSQGCVRMRQAAIEELFEILPKGAVITVQP